MSDCPSCDRYVWLTLIPNVSILAPQRQNHQSAVTIWTVRALLGCAPHVPDSKTLTKNTTSRMLLQKHQYMTGLDFSASDSWCFFLLSINNNVKLLTHTLDSRNNIVTLSNKHCNGFDERQSKVHLWDFMGLIFNSVYKSPAIIFLLTLDTETSSFLSIKPCESVVTECKLNKMTVSAYVIRQLPRVPAKNWR